MLTFGAHKQLRSRSDKAIDRKRVALRESLGESFDQPPGTECRLGPYAHVARENDLLELAVANRPLGLCHRVEPRHLGGRGSPVPDAVVLGRLVLVDLGFPADACDPRTSVAASDDDRGDDEYRAGLQGVDGERPERPGTTSRHADFALDS